MMRLQNRMEEEGSFQMGDFNYEKPFCGLFCPEEMLNLSVTTVIWTALTALWWLEFALKMIDLFT